MVITGLTRNQFESNLTRVRIPLSPPKFVGSFKSCRLFLCNFSTFDGRFLDFLNLFRCCRVVLSKKRRFWRELRLFPEAETIQHCVCGCQLGRVVEVCISICRRGKIAVTEPVLDFLHLHTVLQKQTGTTVPLRYNYDKPEKPRISRVFGYQARFFILFQPEKSSREVVIS